MSSGEQNRAERRLAAILAADVAGYSRLVGADEEATLTRLRSIRAELIDPTIATYRGRLVKTTGDGLLVEFASVVDALRCATDWQQAMAERTAGVPPAQRIEFRIGINVGDVVVEDGDIFGDGVNVAARLEALAEPGGICVSARVQEDAAGRLDLAFEDLGEQALKNIARPVRVFRINPKSPHPNPPPQAGEGVARAAAQINPPPQAGEGRVGAGAPPPLALPDKPSIAVLPFQNMSGDPEQEYFVDGMVEEIITALSRIRWLFVIARNSTFTYKGQTVDVKQVGRELGIRYVLEGSVRKAGQRVRITGQLIDAETGAHLWADRFDGSLEDVFELQDKIAISVAGVIEPALQTAEMRRAVRTTDVNAYDLYMRALATYYPITKERVTEALRLLEHAIKIDPRYGPALAWAAVCYSRLLADGWTDQPELARRQGTALARSALQQADADSITMCNAAFALASFGDDIGAMMSVVDRALSLNPSYARGWYLSGTLRNWFGQPDLAIEHIETSLRLSPRERMGHHLSTLGMAYFSKREFHEAAANFVLSIQDHPGSAATYRYLAASYAHIGKLTEAREIVARLRAITAQVEPSALLFRDPAVSELLLFGLRRAIGETI